MYETGHVQRVGTGHRFTAALSTRCILTIRPIQATGDQQGVSNGLKRLVDLRADTTR